jgi:alpha-D-ribose 1-methylphosphonate 5-triphosphate synthase subunit PhnH
MHLLREYIRESLISNQTNAVLQEGIFQDAIAKIKSMGSSTISATKKFFLNLKQELGETKEGAVILGKMAMGKELSPEESDALKTQIKDLAKGIPLLALIALPGGGIATVALVKLAKKFGVDLLPTSFKEG